MYRGKIRFTHPCISRIFAQTLKIIYRPLRFETTLFFVFITNGFWRVLNFFPGKKQKLKRFYWCTFWNEPFRFQRLDKTITIFWKRFSLFINSTLTKQKMHETKYKTKKCFQQKRIWWKGLNLISLVYVFCVTFFWFSNGLQTMLDVVK